MEPSLHWQSIYGPVGVSFQQHDHDLNDGMDRVESTVKAFESSGMSLNDVDAGRRGWGPGVYVSALRPAGVVDSRWRRGCLSPGVAGIRMAPSEVSGEEACVADDSDVLGDDEVFRVCHLVESTPAGISMAPSEGSGDEGDGSWRSDDSRPVNTEESLWRMSQTYGQEYVGGYMWSTEELDGEIEGAVMDTA